MTSEAKSEAKQKKRREWTLELKVGLFVVAAIVAGLIVILLLGQKRHVFESRVTLHAAFGDVQGLRPGAPVWLSGVAVGTVSKIGFGKPGEKEVRVDFEIARDMLKWVHRDSVASIGSQGLLGDKMVQISLGGPESPALRPNDQIATIPPADLNKIVQQAAQVIVSAREVADSAAAAVRQLANPETIDDFRHSMTAIRELLEQAQRGPGLVHGLFYDRRSERQLDELGRSLNKLVVHLDTGAQHLDRVLASIDKDGEQVVNNLSRAALAVDETAASVNRARIAAHLGQASGDLAAITHQVRSGKGTIGALIVDPTVYEQLVTALGGVTRSKVLRALVRYAIKKGEKSEPAREPEPLPPGKVNRAKR